MAANVNQSSGLVSPSTALVELPSIPSGWMAFATGKRQEWAGEPASIVNTMSGCVGLQSGCMATSTGASGRSACGSEVRPAWVGESADLSAIRTDWSGVRSETVSHLSGNGVRVSGSFGLPSASSAEPLDFGYFFIRLSA